MIRRLSSLLVCLPLAACSVGVATADEPVSSLEVATTTSTTSAPLMTSTTIGPETTTTSAPVIEISFDEPELSTAALEPHQTLAARSDHRLDVYARPMPIEPFVTLDAATILGTPRVVQVLEGPVDGWLRVALPIRPNGTEGWIRDEGLTLFLIDRRVDVDLSDRTLVVTGADGIMLETAVAVGSSTSPTPTGSFYITDSVITGNDNGPWGPWAFGLSARSDVITEFNGGDGIIGIHGTNRPGSIGSAASLGCVRVPNEIALELGAMLSAGVPVRISP